MLMRQVGCWPQPLPQVAHGDLRADVRSHALSLALHVKARRSIDAVTVEQRHRWHLQRSGLLNQELRHRRAFEKRERRPSM